MASVPGSPAISDNDGSFDSALIEELRERRPSIAYSVVQEGRNMRLSMQQENLRRGNKQRINVNLAIIAFYALTGGVIRLWPDRFEISEDCGFPYDYFCWGYMGFLIFGILPLRYKLNSLILKHVAYRKTMTMETAITSGYMVFCLIWVILYIVRINIIEQHDPSALYDCQKNCFWYKTSYLEVIILAFIGSIIPFFAILSFILTFPCRVGNYCAMLNDQRQRQVATDRMVASLAQRKFNPEVFTEQTECTICLEEFTTDDMVTPLSCDERHYFHTACITEWVTRKNDCPLCREPINQADMQNIRNN